MELMKLAAAVQLLRFLYTQRLAGFSVPDRPFFDSEETTRWFIEKLRAADAYLEYGSGGSTYLAAQLGKSFVTVDSDPFFLKAVKRKIEKDGFFNSTKQRYCHADIGITREWGFPVYGKKFQRERAECYSNYSDFRNLRDGTLPDFILIDGRFRAACVLKAVRALRSSDGWTIVIDDYLSRDSYRLVESFLTFDRFVGRMAVFSKKADADMDELAKALEQCICDPA
jgi:hypothetical protein